MPESSRHTAILLGIAALYDVAERAGKEPLSPSLELRALLALLHTLGDGRREPYDKFWKHSLSEGLERNHASTNGYMRSTSMRIEILGIGRSLNLELRSTELSNVISEIRARQRLVRMSDGS